MPDASRENEARIEILHRDGKTVLHRFAGSTLREAVLDAVRAGAYLGGANLGDADLRNAYLGGANLGGANLGGADLRNAYLGGANLGGADLGNANLGGADLCNAYLGGANLGGADLRNAYLGGANLRNAKGLLVLASPHPWLFVVVNGDDGPIIYCGCQRFTFAEAREHWSPTHPNWPERTYMPAYVNATEAITKAHGWIKE